MRTGEEQREPDRQTYTLAEVREGIEALTDVDMAKLHKISRALAGKAGMDPDELFQEAICRMLTTRSCSVSFGIVGYTAGVMRSIASDAYRAQVKRTDDGKRTVPFAANDESGSVSADPTPEEEVIAQQYYGECLSRVDEAIAGDEQLQFLVEGIYEGLRGKDLEDFLGTDTKGLAAARKRLMRLLNKAFPEGKPI